MYKKDVLWHANKKKYNNNDIKKKQKIYINIKQITSCRHEPICK